MADNKKEQIASITELLDALREDIPPKASHVWFRGHADSRWKLIPSLGRKKKRVNAESYLIKKFQQSATLLMDRMPASEWDWLFIMQHHGVPTRLLDWTESPLVALYFAVLERPSADGALWVMLPTNLNRHSNIEPNFAADIPSIQDSVLANYSPKTLAGEASSRMDPIAFLAPRNTPRIQAQLGVFTIMHRDPISVDQVGDKKQAWMYKIPKSAKKPLMAELSLLGINKFTLFPELPSIGEVLLKSL